MSMWKITTNFSGSRSIVTMVRASKLEVGSHPKSHVRLPRHFPKTLLEISSTESGSRAKVLSQDINAKLNQRQGCFICEYEDFSIEIQEIMDDRNLIDKRFCEWTSSSSSESCLNGGVLWHLIQGKLVESIEYDSSKSKILMPVSGIQVQVDTTFRKLVLFFAGGDFRSVELRQDKSLSGKWNEHSFYLTPKINNSVLEQLISEKDFNLQHKSDHFVPLLMIILGVWLSLLGFVQYGPMSNEELQATVEEKLSPEFAKVKIEKKQKAAKGTDSLGGTKGGGGTQTANNDPRGGAGYEDEVLVQDRNVLASSIGVLDAFSSLDQKMSNAVNSVGAGIIGGANRAKGILAALGNMSGSGGGGAGVGGIGTKGFGGGGGGGTGNGFGTGVGSGIGKGEAGRGVAFEDSNVSIRGGLEKSEINAVVDENFAQIRFCYNRGLRGNPDLHGKVVSNFIITAEGTVSLSRIASTTLLNSTVENCIRSKISTWQFPKPRGGGSVTVNYPFLLNRT